jgi:CO/xanthine dehydrogenase Mo-binding subunit
VDAHAGPTFAGLLEDIEVDPDTGKIDMLRCRVAQDAGKAIHPSYVEGQMQGGAAQGIACRRPRRSPTLSTAPLGSE